MPIMPVPLHSVLVHMACQNGHCLHALAGFYDQREGAETVFMVSLSTAPFEVRTFNPGGA